MGHFAMENRNGLVASSEKTQARGTAERDSALRMVRSLRGAYHKTLCAERSYETRNFVDELRIGGITPDVAQNADRSGGSANDGHTADDVGYAKSINARKRVEQVFG